MESVRGVSEEKRRRRSLSGAQNHQVAAAADLALINVSANELCSRPLAVINQTNYGNPWECSSLT